MEFNKKLKELRQKKGLTQEELAAKLYVSRAAVSKWESGKGFPNIDSLKAIAVFFSVTVDELLTPSEALEFAEAEGKSRKHSFRDLIFGLTDISTLLLLFLPLFAQRAGDGALSVSLLSLTEVAPYLKIIYIAAVCLGTAFGILTLAMQTCRKSAWVKSKSIISLSIGGVSLFVLVLSLQPYPAVFIMATLLFKIISLVKR